MNKTNEQLIKLAELVQKAGEEQIDESFSDDDMYEKITKMNNKIQ